VTRQEFVVDIVIALPADLPGERRAEIVRAESVRARELRAAGNLVRIWRRPGQTANVGIWAAESATELHDLISSLPMFPWMNVRVSPLAKHPVEDDQP
jgi:muconolactone D-isomerase